jgi:hypothetical protein
MTTNIKKEQYIKRIRSESAYPTFRLLTNIFAIIFYIIGGFFAICGVFGGVFTMTHDFVQGVVVLIFSPLLGALYIIIGKVAKETSSMLADVADSIMDLNCRD